MLDSLVHWYNQTGSPPAFDRFCARWTPWAFAVAFATLAVCLWGGLFAVPADYQQGENFRILYLHVPAAWMSLFIYIVMAIQALIALVWRIKACEILAMACAPVGAAFTLVTLVTGSIWGRPTWGTWWEWDPRLTSELVLLFLYIGVMGLIAAIEDRRAAARGAAFLALVGLVYVPIVHFAVSWWNTLHQGTTIRLLGPSKMDSSMLWPLLFTVIGTKAWFVGSLLQRARAINLEHEAGKRWVLEGRDAP
jgi:heme exporter protein C